MDESSQWPLLGQLGLLWEILGKSPEKVNSLDLMGRGERLRAVYFQSQLDFQSLYDTLLWSLSALVGAIVKSNQAVSAWAEAKQPTQSGWKSMPHDNTNTPE